MGAVPALTANREWIAMDLQGHGRTADMDRPMTFEQHADDVAALLKHLNIEQADFLGDSFGGTVAVMMAVRHADLVRRVATYVPSFGALKGGRALSPDAATVRRQREDYQGVAPEPKQWPVLVAKVLDMKWNGFSNEELRAITVPVLIASGDHDFTPVERYAEWSRLIPTGQLAIIPDAGHFTLMSEPERLLPVVAAFFDAPTSKVPLGTAMSGYYPGETR
jgi:pimeloyl-ACP methyl ester carboxylesterase